MELQKTVHISTFIVSDLAINRLNLTDTTHYLVLDSVCVSTVGPFTGHGCIAINPSLADYEMIEWKSRGYLCVDSFPSNMSTDHFIEKLSWEYNHSSEADCT